MAKRQSRSDALSDVRHLGNVGNFSHIQIRDFRAKIQQNSTRKGGQIRTIAKKKVMLKALQSYMGVVAGACDKARIDRHTHYNWLRTDQDYAEKVEAIGERALDLAESKLFQLIKKENPQAVFFLLETRGKKRGYTKKQETELSGRMEIPLVKFKVPEEFKWPQGAIHSKRKTDAGINGQVDCY